MLYLKKNKTLSVCVSLEAVLKACNFIKKRLQYSYSPVNIPKVLGTAFFIEQLQWLLLH